MPIKLACCSDTHGQLPPALDETGVAAWLHAGDVYEEGEAVADLRAWLDGRAAPVYAVRGNHDYDDPQRFFDRCIEITGAARELAPGLLVAGIGWHGLTASDLPGTTELERICEMVRGQHWRKARLAADLILVMHYPADVRELFPPTGSGSGWMYQRLREFIEELRPMLVVQGHVHEWFGTSATFEYESGRNLYKTLIVNPGPSGMVVTIPPHSAHPAAIAL